MQKAELTEIVDLAHSAFGAGTPEKITYQSWWRYLGDLTAADVQRALDVYVVSGERFLPRPGELRRAVIDRLHPEVLPDANQAWAIAKARLEAVATGMDIPLSGSMETDLAVGEVLRGSPANREERAFKAAWDATITRRCADRYALPEQEDAS